jgi:hypothetical protein
MVLSETVSLICHCPASSGSVVKIRLSDLGEVNEEIVLLVVYSEVRCLSPKGIGM